jgi:hypothetical protein
LIVKAGGAYNYHWDFKGLRISASERKSFLAVGPLRRHREKRETTNDRRESINGYAKKIYRKKC